MCALFLYFLKCFPVCHYFANITRAARQVKTLISGRETGCLLQYRNQSVGSFNIAFDIIVEHFIMTTFVTLPQEDLGYERQEKGSNVKGE